MMLALHRSDVADLNQRARLHLIANDRLGPVVLDSEDLELRAGDRVLALRNDRKIGIVNGTIGIARRRRPRRCRSQSATATAPPCWPTTSAAGHLTHGYAMTIHKSQGMTCDVALVLGDDTLHKEAGHTSITRGRERNHVYAVAAQEPEGRPADDLRRALAVSTAKQTAHDRGGLRAVSDRRPALRGPARSRPGSARASCRRARPRHPSQGRALAVAQLARCPQPGLSILDPDRSGHATRPRAS
ncbi:MAG: ATP-dependent RecD-like DNA helicase [Acidimicrobiales bacterium]